MTGFAEIGLPSQAVLPPGTEFLQKPFTRDALIRQIRQVLGTAHAQISN